MYKRQFRCRLHARRRSGFFQAAAFLLAVGGCAAGPSPLGPEIMGRSSGVLIPDVPFYPQEAISRMPEDPDAYNNLAWMFYMCRIRLQEAESLARRALILAPPDNRAPFADTLEHILTARRPDPLHTLP